MKIASAEIELQSSHVAFKRTEVSERLEMWVGDRNRERPRASLSVSPLAELASARVDLSSKGKAASEAEAVREEADLLDSDPRLKLLRNLIELLTGRPLRVINARDIARPVETPAPPDHAPAVGVRARDGAGFGIEYEYNSSYQEYERTTFQASGSVRTADGREIHFDLALEMERSYAESLNIQFRAGDAVLKDPLILDFGGPAASLSNVRFEFDLDADGEMDQVPLLNGGRGFLAFDRDQNGVIDDGRELFGPTTGNGFAELAALDSDGNGWIDEGDAAYAQLRVWQPAPDGNGSLQTLAEANVGAIHLGDIATPYDLRGPANETLGVMRSTGVYLREDGTAGTVSQVDLSV